MSEKRAKKLNKEHGKIGRKAVQQAERDEKIRKKLPHNPGHSSKKRHANESLYDFRKRRKKTNAYEKLKKAGAFYNQKREINS